MSLVQGFQGYGLFVLFILGIQIIFSFNFRDMDYLLSFKGYGLFILYIKLILKIKHFIQPVTEKCSISNFCPTLNYSLSVTNSPYMFVLKIRYPSATYIPFQDLTTQCFGSFFDKKKDRTDIILLMWLVIYFLEVSSLLHQGPLETSSCITYF